MKSYLMLDWFSGRKAAMPSVLCAFIFAADASAQTEMAPRTGNEMALRLLSLARTAPEVLQAESELYGKAADVRAASLQQYPKFEVQTSLGPSNSELPNTLAVADGRITAGIRYTVFDSGKSAARLLAAEGGLQIEEHRARQAVETVIFDALSSYLQILRFELLLSVAQSSETALREIETLEARKVTLGGAGITDSRVAGTRLALSANKLLQFQSSLEDSRTVFSTLFGFTPAKGELPVARVPVPWLDLGSTGVADEALSNNAEIAEANSTIRQSQATATAERASRFPTVDVTVTKGYEFPGAVTAPARLGLQLTLSSGTMLEGRAKADKAAAQVNTDQAKLGVVTRNVTQRALSAWRRTITGYQREQVLSQAALGSGEVFKARKRLNAAGRETTMALLDAQVEENNVYIDWVNAMFDARLSELKLAKELGKLTPPQGSDQAWASSFYQAEDYREVVRRQLSATMDSPLTRATSNNKEKPLQSLGAIGQDYTFRIDGLKTASHQVAQNFNPGATRLSP